MKESQNVTQDGDNSVNVKKKERSSPTHGSSVVWDDSPNSL